LVAINNNRTQHHTAPPRTVATSPPPPLGNKQYCKLSGNAEQREAIPVVWHYKQVKRNKFISQRSKTAKAILIQSHDTSNPVGDSTRCPFLLVSSVKRDHNLYPRSATSNNGILLVKYPNRIFSESIYSRGFLSIFSLVLLVQYSNRLASLAPLVRNSNRSFGSLNRTPQIDFFREHCVTTINSPSQLQRELNKYGPSIR